MPCVFIFEGLVWFEKRQPGRLGVSFAKNFHSRCWRPRLIDCPNQVAGTLGYRCRLPTRNNLSLWCSSDSFDTSHQSSDLVLVRVMREQVKDHVVAVLPKHCEGGPPPTVIFYYNLKALRRGIRQPALQFKSHSGAGLFRKHALAPRQFCIRLVKLWNVILLISVDKRLYNRVTVCAVFGMSYAQCA